MVLIKEVKFTQVKTSFLDFFIVEVMRASSEENCFWWKSQNNIQSQGFIKEMFKKILGALYYLFVRESKRLD